MRVRRLGVVLVKCWHGIVFSYLYWGYQISMMSAGSPMVSWDEAQYYRWLRKHSS